jgi:hypothetical protein
MPTRAESAVGGYITSEAKALPRRARDEAGASGDAKLYVCVFILFELSDSAFAFKNVCMYVYEAIAQKRGKRAGLPDGSRVAGASAGMPKAKSVLCCALCCVEANLSDRMQGMMERQARAAGDGMPSCVCCCGDYTIVYDS